MATWRHGGLELHNFGANFIAKCTCVGNLFFFCYFFLLSFYGVRNTFVSSISNGYDRILGKCDVEESYISRKTAIGESRLCVLVERIALQHGYLRSFHGPFHRNTDWNGVWITCESFWDHNERQSQDTKTRRWAKSTTLLFNNFVMSVD